jgi:hypothetical protein
VTSTDPSSDADVTVDASPTDGDRCAGGCQPRVEANAQTSCLVRADGTVACWGYNYRGVAFPPAAQRMAISVGFLHTCGVLPGTTIDCWSGNDYGQASPAAGTFKPAGTFTSIAAGDMHTCGRRTTGELACWGDNTYAQSTPP